MTQLIYGFKREYWEHKRLLFIMPAIVTALFVLMAIVATWTQDDPMASLNTPPTIQQPAADEKDSTTLSQNQNAAEQQTNTPAMSISDHQQTTDSNDNGLSFWFAGVFLGAGWLSAFFYALSSLYSDRRNKSILYWKTMPVPELQTVLHKFLFALIAFSTIAVVIAWITGTILIGYAHLALPAEMMAGDEAGMSFPKLFIWPLLTIIVGTLWCAPFFAYVLFISATAKKMPFLLFLVPIYGLYIIEKIIFGSSSIYQFFSSHSPFCLISTISDMNSAKDFLNFYFIDQLASLLLGLIIAALFVSRAAWLRDRRFDL